MNNFSLLLLTLNVLLQIHIYPRLETPDLRNETFTSNSKSVANVSTNSTPQAKNCLLIVPNVVLVQSDGVPFAFTIATILCKKN